MRACSVKLQYKADKGVAYALVVRGAHWRELMPLYKWPLRCGRRVNPGTWPSQLGIRWLALPHRIVEPQMENCVQLQSGQAYLILVFRKCIVGAYMRTPH